MTLEELVLLLLMRKKREKRDTVFVFENAVSFFLFCFVLKYTLSGILYKCDDFFVCYKW